MYQLYTDMKLLLSKYNIEVSPDHDAVEYCCSELILISICDRIVSLVSISNVNDPPGAMGALIRFGPYPAAKGVSMRIDIMLISPVKSLWMVRVALSGVSGQTGQTGQTGHIAHMDGHPEKRTTRPTAATIDRMIFPSFVPLRFWLTEGVDGDTP